MSERLEVMMTEKSPKPVTWVQFIYVDEDGGETPAGSPVMFTGFDDLVHCSHSTLAGDEATHAGVFVAVDVKVDIGQAYGYKEGSFICEKLFRLNLERMTTAESYRWEEGA